MNTDQSTAVEILPDRMEQICVHPCNPWPMLLLLLLFCQTGEEAGFVPDLEAEFAGLGEFAAGGFAGDDEAGLLRDAARDLAAQSLQARAGLVARHRRQAASEHHRLPGERAF